jgi:hypothetical protein
VTAVVDLDLGILLRWKSPGICFNAAAAAEFCSLMSMRRSHGQISFRRSVVADGLGRFGAAAAGARRLRAGCLAVLPGPDE